MSHVTRNDPFAALWQQERSSQCIEWLNVIHSGSIERLAITRAIREDARVGDEVERIAEASNHCFGVSLLMH